MKNINIVIMGAPNSGKGTLCEGLSKKFNLFQLSTGQILRDNIEKGTPLGKIAEPHMLDIVPEDLVTKMVIEKINTLQGFNGILFDGYPRTISQALALDDNVNIDLIILLDYDQNEEDKLIARALNRRICLKCKATLSASRLSDGACPYCGGEVQKRDDANVENIKKRLEVYKKETFPVIDYYADRVLKINALEDKEITLKKAEEIIKNILVRE